LTDKTADIRIFRAADIALIALLLAFAGAFWLMPGARADSSGGMVSVKLRGEAYALLPVSRDATLDVTLPDGAVCNTVAIAGGRVFMQSAACPDGLCLRHGDLRGGRDVIVCLPNAVTVEFADEPRGADAVDAVVG
jgi:hypothetical protein